MKCILCGGADTRQHLDERLVRCSGCSLVRAADRYFSMDPRSLYTRKYFEGDAYVPGETEYVDYNRERRALARNFRRRARLIDRLAPGSQSLIEIGSGYGFFLEVAAAHWDVEGFEISEHAAGVARSHGVRCVNADYLESDEPGRDADIGCLWDTIEHLASPRRVLEKLATDVKPGGLVAVSTGDIASLLARHQGSRWRLIHPPTHLWYFSAATLSALLEAVGFEPIRVVRPHYYRSLRTYVGGLAKHLPESVGDMPIPLQTGDLMEIYARRTAG